MLMTPSLRRICATLSVKFKKENPVSPARRIAADPVRSSARAPLSVQSLSPVLIGRFTTAETQSSVPAGSKETEPCIYPRRATRPGGSSSSATALGGTQSPSPRASVSMLNVLNNFIIAFSP